MEYEEMQKELSYKTLACLTLRYIKANHPKDDDTLEFLAVLIRSVMHVMKFSKEEEDLYVRVYDNLIKIKASKGKVQELSLI